MRIAVFLSAASVLLAGCAVPASSGRAKPLDDTIVSMVAFESVLSEHADVPLPRLAADALVSGISAKGYGYRMEIHNKVGSTFNVNFLCVGLDPMPLASDCQSDSTPRPLDGGWFYIASPTKSFDFGAGPDTIYDGIHRRSQLTALHES